MRTKQTFQIFVMLTLILGITSNGFAQEKAEDNRKAAIKIVKEIDGKITEIDRTIELQEGESLEDALERTGLDKEMEAVEIGGKDMDIDVDVKIQADGDQKQVRKMKKMIFMGKDGEMKEIERSADTDFFHFESDQGADVKVIDKDGKKVVIVKQKDGSENVIKIEGEKVDVQGNDENVFIIKDGEHVHGDGEKIHKIKKMHKNTNKASLGVMLTQEIENENGVETNSGVVVKKVLEGSAAEEAGLQKGDIIKGIDGKEITDYKEILDALSKFEAEDKVAIDYERDGKRASTEATLKANTHQWTSKDEEEHKIIIKQMGDGDENIDIEQIIEEGNEDEAEEKIIIIKKKIEGEKDVEIEIEKIIEKLEGLELEEGKEGNVMIIKKRMNGDQMEVEVENNISYNVWIKDVEEADVEKIENASLKKAATDNTHSVESLQFYPNPSDGRFDLSFTLPEKGKTVVRVVDMAGKEVFQDKLGNFTGVYEKQIDISNNAKGIYFLQVEQNEQVMMKKIVVQ